VVVFVDEIDSTIGLAFADDFFAAIRACYNARADEAVFERLSFVLLGVASPDQLITDPERTPFNVGRRVELTDFTRDEARWLASGLGESEGDELLRRVSYWTGGQPYLTQVLCQQVTEEGGEGEEAVDQIVSRHFLSERALREETHLRHIRARLLAGHGEARRRLTLYLRILRGETVNDKPASSLVATLKLSGVVRVRDDGTLAVRNRLYEKVFTAAWTRREMPADRTRQVIYGSAALMITAFLAVYGVILPELYARQLELATRDYRVAETAYRKLRSNPFARWPADELMAQFWDRRARSEALEGDRDRALFAWLQALRSAQSDQRRREVRQIIAADYEYLRAYLRHGDGGWFLVELDRLEISVGVILNVETFSPDGQTVLTGSAEGTARLWSAQTGEAIGKPMRHKAAVFAVAFSPDGQTVLTGSKDETARLWTAQTGQAIGKPMEHIDSVRAVAFSPDGQTVLTGSSEGTAQLWSAQTGQATGQWKMIHKDSVRAVAFSPDGQTVLTGSDDGTAQLWSAQTGETIGHPMQHDYSVLAVAFSPDGQTVLTGSVDRMAHLWSVQTGQAIGQPMQHDDSVRAVAFSPDGQTVLTGSIDSTARLWSAKTGQAIGQPMQHDSWVLALAFSPDGQTVLTGSRDSTARLWSVQTSQVIGPPMQHDDSVRAVAFSPNGQIVLTGSEDRTACLWSAQTGEAIGQPMQHDSGVLAVAFRPDGQTVLTGSSDQTARLWSAQTGEAIGQPMQHDSGVLAVAFSPDGQSVLTGSSDRTARLWSAQTGEAIGQPMQHDDSVLAVAFSPDGQTVLTGSTDRTGRLWSAQMGEAIGSPVQYDSGVRAVAFSPDGNTALVSTDRWLHVHTVTDGGLEHRTSRFLGRGWTGVHRFSDACVDCLDIAVRPTANSVALETIHLFEPDAPPIEGDPDELLEEWQRRLGLEFDEEMNIVPRR
jgi:WD40 repeat protein